MLQMHVTSRFDQCEEDSSSTSTDDENDATKPGTSFLALLQVVQKKENQAIQYG